MINSSYKPALDLNEFITQCVPNQQAMIYGFRDCDTAAIRYWLILEIYNGRFKGIFNNSIGYNQISDRTYEGRKIYKIRNEARYEDDTGIRISTVCKNALVNLVIENFKREVAELPIIPIIFVVGKDDLKIDIKKVLQKLPKRNLHNTELNITDSEIRRAYRLCSDPSLPEVINRVAHKSFVFISLATNKVDDDVKYKFSILPAPWNSQLWEPGWKKRKMLPKEVNRKNAPWRDQMKVQFPSQL